MSKGPWTTIFQRTEKKNYIKKKSIDSRIIDAMVAIVSMELWMVRTWTVLKRAQTAANVPALWISVSLTSISVRRSNILFWWFWYALLGLKTTQLLYTYNSNWNCVNVNFDVSNRIVRNSVWKRRAKSECVQGVWDFPFGQHIHTANEENGYK